MNLPLLLSFILGLVLVANSQAPGDSDGHCPNRTDYESHQRVLMDSWSYDPLLPPDSDPTGGVWQSLDVDADGVLVRRLFIERSGSFLRLLFLVFSGIKMEVTFAKKWIWCVEKVAFRTIG